MTRQTWSKEKVIQKAKKYTARVDFKRGSIGAYRAAIRYGILDFVCSHMKNALGRHRKKWTPDKLHKEALKCNTKRDFSKNNSGAYSTAARLGILNDICSHMDILKGKWTKETIKKEALKYTTRSEFRKQSGGAADAANRQGIYDEVCSHMKFARDINRKWTNAAVIAEARKYNTRIEFKTSCPGAHQAACKLKILDEAYSHMESGMKTWSKEELIAEALKYKSRTSFKKNNSNAYVTANKMGILDEICQHITLKVGAKQKWIKEQIQIEALRYSSRTEFRDNNRGAHSAAHRLNIIDEVCSHMIIENKWTKETVTREALKYQTRKEFRVNCSGACAEAHRQGIMDEVCSHMKPPTNKPWTKEKLIKEAKKYNTRNEFRRNGGGAHKAATAMGILDEICSHMELLWEMKWTKETLQKEALNYSTRSKFRVNSSGAYSAAYGMGILDEICSHMSKLHERVSDSVYMWTSEEFPHVWKFGRCCYDLLEERTKRVAKDGKFTIKDCHIRQVSNALEAEKMLLKTGKSFDFGCKFDGYTEFRILNEEELFYAKEFFGIN